MIKGHIFIKKTFYLYLLYLFLYMEESLGHSKVMRFRGVEGGIWYRKVQEEFD